MPKLSLFGVLRVTRRFLKANRIFPTVWVAFAGDVELAYRLAQGQPSAAAVMPRGRDGT